MDESLMAGEQAGHSPEVEDAKGDATSPPIPRGNYSQDALTAAQLPVTDLIPTRLWLTWLLALGGLSLVAGIELLYWYVHRPMVLGDWVPVACWAALDVSGPGNLAAWFSAAIFGMMAALSLLVYGLRRHKVDDYRGRYRWWLWLSPAFMLISIEQATHLHRLLVGFLQTSLAGPLHLDAVLWWGAFSLVLCAVVTARLAMEVWSSRIALLWLVIASSAYAACLVLAYGWWPVEPAAWKCLVSSSCLLVGHWSLFCSALFFSRYVYLDVRGQVVTRKRRSKRTKAARPAKAGSAWAFWNWGRGSRDGRSAEGSDASKRSGRKSTRRLRVDAAHAIGAEESTGEGEGDSTRSIGRNVAGASVRRPLISPVAEEELDEDEEGYEGESLDHSRLTKAQRKRLRKKQRLGEPSSG